ncbi:MAG: hypothetical protein AB1489_08935 [Acidobacteriota bacterium]
MGTNHQRNPEKIAEEIIAVVLQCFAEYSFVHTPEQLQTLVTEPESDPIFLHELKDDILDIINQG